jgi:hypothetical protein
MSSWQAKATVFFFCQKIQGELGKFTGYSPTTILGTEGKESFYQPRKQRVDQTLDPQYETDGLRVRDSNRNRAAAP